MTDLIELEKLRRQILDAMIIKADDISHLLSYINTATRNKYEKTQPYKYNRIVHFLIAFGNHTVYRIRHFNHECSIIELLRFTWNRYKKEKVYLINLFQKLGVEFTQEQLNDETF